MARHLSLFKLNESQADAEGVLPSGHGMRSCAIINCWLCALHTYFVSTSNVI